MGTFNTKLPVNVIILPGKIIALVSRDLEIVLISRNKNAKQNL